MSTTARLPQAYRVLIGLNYGTHRAEPGDVVTDLPRGSVAWLLRQGIVERVEEGEDGD